MKKIFLLFTLYFVCLLGFNSITFADAKSNENSYYENDLYDYSTITDLIDEYQSNYPSKSDDELGLIGFAVIKTLRDNAISKNEDIYGHNGDKDDSDAFRHIYFTILLTKTYSKEFAITLMTYHEDGKNDLSSKMDLHNNSIAIILYNRWLEKNSSNNITNYITHAIYYGYFYNIYKVTKENNVEKLVYTNIGIGNQNYLLSDIYEFSNLSTYEINENEYIWLSYKNTYVPGTFSTTSNNRDICIESYDSLDIDNTIATSNNSSTNFYLNVGETKYLKIYTAATSTISFTLTLSQTSTQDVKYTYIKYNKSYHYKRGNDGTYIKEIHTLNSIGKSTYCKYCGQTLDANVDGPFVIRLY